MSDNITHRSDSSQSDNLLTEKEQELLPHERKIKRKKHHVAPIFVNLAGRTLSIQIASTLSSSRSSRI
jgi:hypothetical protein